MQLGGSCGASPVGPASRSGSARTRSGTPSLPPPWTPGSAPRRPRSRVTRRSENHNALRQGPPVPRPARHLHRRHFHRRRLTLTDRSRRSAPPSARDAGPGPNALGRAPSDRTWTRSSLSNERTGSMRSAARRCCCSGRTADWSLGARSPIRERRSALARASARDRRLSDAPEGPSRVVPDARFRMLAAKRETALDRRLLDALLDHRASVTGHSLADGPRGVRSRRGADEPSAFRLANTNPAREVATLIADLALERVGVVRLPDGRLSVAITNPTQ